MSIRNSRKRNSRAGHVVDGVPQAVAHGAEEAANRLSGAAEAAGSRIAQRASKAGIRAGDLGDQIGNAAEIAGNQLTKRANLAGSRASDLGSQLGTRANELGSQVGDRVGSAHVDVGQSRSRFAKQLSGAGGGMRVKLRRSPDVLLKAQLAKTSRELAHESSDLGHAVNSLNSVIRANRKSAAKGRTRLIGGLAIGAAAMYHLDAEHGRERRAATAHRVVGIFRGNRESRV